MRKYTCEDNIASVTVLAPDKSCLFCKHCTDVYWDYINGPYMTICAEDHDEEIGGQAKCEYFEEDNAAVNNIEHDFGSTIKKIVDKNKEPEQEEVTAANLVNSITYISHYCHSLQSCNKCLIKKWCKEKRKKCPEEWTYTDKWSYSNN